MKKELTIGFIGGGNMAAALASGLIGQHCQAADIHIVDINADVLEQWADKGASTAQEPGPALTPKRVWILSVKPQYLKQAVKAAQPFLAPDTLVISVAAGISAATLAQWLGSGDTPWTRLVRCMPNTPALIGAGVSGLMALDGVTSIDRDVAEQLLSAVGQVVWVDSDAAIDAVTALSGSGPAYVFLFLETLIQGGIALGLSAEQARTLALATVDGATRLAHGSPDDLATLRQKVTSEGGTTAAALAVLQQDGFAKVVTDAMHAACQRAGQLSEEYSK